MVKEDSHRQRDEPGADRPAPDQAAADTQDSGGRQHKWPGDGRIRSFVRRQARMTPAQERALTDLAPRFVLDPANLGQGLGSRELFGNDHDVILEIGFGMGHATAEMADSHREANFLGAEVHGPGVGALLIRAASRELENLRIWHGDVQELLMAHLASGSLAAVHLFFPDPWPKKKHHKRRLVQSSFLDRLAPYCRLGARLYMVTDWEDYGRWMVEAVGASRYWRNSCADFCPPQDWRPVTAFERKGLGKGHVIREILAIRVEPEV